MLNPKTSTLTKQEKRELLMHQAKELFSKFQFTLESYIDDPAVFFAWGSYFLNFDMAFCIKLGVHLALYLDSLHNMGTDKHKLLVKRGVLLEELGCFALTELGHGSNVANLGTTAHFVKETQEFELNTPDSLSAKWWIGGAAQTCTKCVVLAQLYVNGVHEGLHGFVIDLRDKSTFQVKPGIILGDCGKKFGNDAIDNGFIIFSKHRVPYDALLDRISQINSNGEFVSSVKRKEKRLGLLLTSLIRGRSAVIGSSEGNLKNALTTAIRWAAVRKQFGPREGIEIPILDYPLTRFRIVPVLANLFGIKAAAEIIFQGYLVVSKLAKMSLDSFEGVEYHIVLSALKVLTSEWAFKGIHQCRTLCGGIGYSSFTRLGELLAGQDVNLTWEGDNNILLQQVAGFVVKTAMKTMQGIVIKGTTLKNIEVTLSETSSKQWSGKPNNSKDLLFALTELFNILISKSLRTLQKNSETLKNYTDVWNYSQSTLQELGRLFGILQIANHWLGNLNHSECKVTCEVVENLFQIFILEKLIRYKSELIASGFVNGEAMNELEKYFERLCVKIGESSVKIIDGIANDDSIVNSCIGLVDGQAYKNLTTEVESMPDCYKMETWVEDIRNIGK